MILCVIPCREQSKRTPGKNSRLFNGKPLVERTLDQARELKFIDKIVLTSDDLTLSKYLEFELRSKHLASDESPIQDTIDMLWDKYKPDILIVLQVTTPQRVLGDILTAYTMFKDNPHYNSLVPVNPDNRPNGCIFMTRSGKMYDSPMIVFETKDYYIDIDYDYEFKIAEALCK